MKKFIFLVIFCLATVSFTFAQSSLSHLEKLKQIKLLESTREDVKRIFGENQDLDAKDEPEDEDSEAAEDSENEADAEDDSEDADDPEGDTYYGENITIRISYARGKCFDKDANEEWNVASGKVTEIDVVIEDEVKIKDLKIDLSKLERINMYDEEEDAERDDYIFYDKKKGVSYVVEEGLVKNIKLTPTEDHSPALCIREDNEDFTSAKEWFREKIKDRFSTVSGGCSFANVNEVILDKKEITMACAPASAEKIGCPDNSAITIETKGESSDPNEVLIYNYTVSGGKIVGRGASVTWDLSGVGPGTYTITAGVDNGCGVCGTTKTVEVVIKECPDCAPK